jgi:putative component of membrane protein insertase Oxa1/YidC/SpoIIIJ protein YidD
MQISGERVFRCKECFDEGLVIVWHWRSMIDMRKWLNSTSEEPFKGRRYSCGVRCNCSAGAKWSQKVFFSDVSMCRCSYHPTLSDVEALQAHVIHEGVGTEWTGGADF